MCITMKENYKYAIACPTSMLVDRFGNIVQ